MRCVKAIETSGDFGTQQFNDNRVGCIIVICCAPKALSLRTSSSTTSVVMRPSGASAAKRPGKKLRLVRSFRPSANSAAVIGRP